MDKFTPGPWSLDPTMGRCTRANEGGFEVITKGDNPTTLCTRYPYAERADEMLANGRLIAAAPDLLALVREYRQMVYDDGVAADQERLDRIDATIDRATGVRP